MQEIADTLVVNNKHFFLQIKNKKSQTNIFYCVADEGNYSACFGLILHYYNFHYYAKNMFQSNEKCELRMQKIKNKSK